MANYAHANPNWQYNPSQTTWGSPYQYPQPSPSPMRQLQQPYMLQTFDNIVRVSGPEGAKEFKMGPNSRAVLMDDYNPVFYLKTTDDGGFATMRTFKFEEVFSEEPKQVQAVAVDPEVYATKDDVKAIEESLAEVKHMMEGLM